VIVTVVALVAATVKVDGLPAGTEVGLAVIATVGAAVEPLKLVPPHPEKSTGNNRPGAIETRTLRIDMPKRAFAKVISFSPTRGYAKPARFADTRIQHSWPDRPKQVGTTSAIVSVYANAGLRLYYPRAGIPIKSCCRVTPELLRIVWMRAGRN
jgi:hypothetical protein